MTDRSHPPLAPVTRRLASLGSAMWAVHYEARRRIAAGEALIELTIGEPDVAPPAHLLAATSEAMRAGRTRYSAGTGDPSLLDAVAAKYAARTGRAIGRGNILALPGTQAALATVMMALAGAGDEVLVPDPYYATYEGVVGLSGADFVAVPMSPENGFHLTADQLEAAITPRSRVLLLNSPHNPTGAVLSRDEIAAIGAVCARHDLWIVSDEVYEHLIFGDTAFASPFDEDELAGRTVVCASISKSHAAPGFRAGWAVGPSEVMAAILPVSEALLFGGQPFIMDGAARALADDGATAAGMRAAYARRADLVAETLSDEPLLSVLAPEAGMFALVDVSATGVDGGAFAMAALDHGVAVMPGPSFGSRAQQFVRLSLTVDDERIAQGASRLVSCAHALRGA